MADINSENTGEAKDTGAQLSERQQLLTSGAVAESLGRKLMRLRQDRGLSQRELARRAEMTNSTL